MNTVEIKLRNVRGKDSTSGNSVQWQELVNMRESFSSKLGGDYQFLRTLLLWT